MKYCYVFLFLVLSHLSFSQTETVEKRSGQQPAAYVTGPILSDSLKATRHLLSTSIYKSDKLKKAEVVQLLKDYPAALTTFKWGNRLKIVGPILSISGLVLGYIGIKGSEETATVAGIKTALNRNVPDVQVQYTERSLAKTLGGVGLFVGGMCLIELANGLTNKSVVLYNTKSVSSIKSVNVGLTTSGGMGLEAHF